MKEDKIAACFKEKLTGHESNVPEMLWNRVEAELPPVRSLRTRRYRYLSLAAAAAVALVVGVSSFWLLSRNSTPLQEAADVAVVAEELVPMVLSETGETSGEDKAVQMRPVIPERPLYAEAEQPVAEPSGEENGKEQLAVCIESKPSPATTHTVAIADKPAQVVLPEIGVIDTSQYDSRALAAIIQSVGKPVLPSHWFSVKANAMRADVAPVQYVMRAGSQEIIYRHKMPLSLTASFEKRFGRWGVGTGVTYTFMSSDYEMANNERLGTQTLHYLGLPLYVSFNIAKVKRFSFYASAGGEADFNIAGIQRESPDSQAFDVIKEKKMCDKKPQFSVQARVGAAFELMRHFDLYIEPTLGYYFHHESPVHSVWNDRPWNVSLSLGVRTGF